jgi:quercetin dioxygenase-like cupin family protein
MRAKHAMFILLWIVPLPLEAQAPSPISIDQEPHHHFAFRNDYIEIHQILLPPGDAFQLHRHDMDEIAIVISGATTIGESLGKPSVHQTTETGRVSYARAPRVHLVRNIGTTTMHNVAVTLLHPQANLRNLCATPNADQPASCAAASPESSNSPYFDQPQFETDQMRTTLTRVRPKKSAPIDTSGRDELFVAIDEIVVSPAAGKGPDKVLHSGDFLWISRNDARTLAKNPGEKEVRFATLAFKPI